MAEKTHELKVWREFFGALADGTKTFEVRKDDRSFAVGDLLHLREFDPYLAQQYVSGFTGSQITKRVTYKLPGGKFGIDPDFCVLGLGQP